MVGYVNFSGADQSTYPFKEPTQVIFSDSADEVFNDLWRSSKSEGIAPCGPACVVLRAGGEKLLAIRLDLPPLVINECIQILAFKT